MKMHSVGPHFAHKLNKAPHRTSMRPWLETPRNRYAVPVKKTSRGRVLVVPATRHRNVNSKAREVLELRHQKVLDGVLDSRDVENEWTFSHSLTLVVISRGPRRGLGRLES